MKLKVYDQLIILGWLGTVIYVIWIWLPTIHQASGTFNIIGAIFAISMATVMIKFSIASTGIFLEWGLPRLSKRFKNFKFSKAGNFTLFNKRLEIRIIDTKNSGKVTF